MQTIWHIRGPKAATFESVEDDEAKRLSESGDAQIADGVTPLETPEGHPDYQKPPAAPKQAGPGRPRKKYQNKMETTDDE